MRHAMTPRFSMSQSGQAGGFMTTCGQGNGPAQPAGRRAVASRVRPRTLGLEWNFPQVPRDRCELIFLDRGCLDKDTNTNEVIAVSRITQNDQSGLLEPGYMKFVMGLLAAVLLLAGM